MTPETKDMGDVAKPRLTEMTMKIDASNIKKVIDDGIAELKQRNLRDEFAMAALNGMLSAGPFKENTTYGEIASECFRWADLMLAERNKEQK